MTLPNPKLQKFYQYLVEDVAPIANWIDRDPMLLRNAFEYMVKHQLFGLFLPISVGGMGLTKQEFHDVVVNIAKTSGALMLLQTQYQSGIAMIHNYASDKFKEKWLPLALTGNCCIGLGFSHLHQYDKPPVRAQETNDYFHVSGTIRYATGHGFFNHIIIGFATAQKEYMALVPFEIQTGFHIHDELELVACQSTATVSIELKDYIIPKDAILFEKPLGYFHNASIYLHMRASTHIGTALAILNLIENSPVFSALHVQTAYYALKNRVDRYELKVKQLLDTDNISSAPIRVQGLILINDALMIAEQLFRGAVAQPQHILNRLKNESQLFAALASGEEMLIAVCESIIKSYSIAKSAP